MPDYGLDGLEKDLKLCIQHLQETNNMETRLGDLFVRFISGYIYGEYQKFIREAIIQRAEKSGDAQLARYVELSTRRLGMGAYALQHDIFDVFGKDLNETLISVPNSIWGAYKRLVKIRNKAMHGGDVRESLDEVMQLHQAAKKAIYAMQVVLLGGREYSAVSDNPSDPDFWE